MSTAVTSSPYRITMEDLHQEKGPLYTNTQSTPVGVYTPTGKKMYVLPWNQRPDPKQDEKPTPSQDPAAVYCVRGMHYNAFAGPAGPLTPFLDRSRAIPAGSSPASVEALRHAASQASRHAAPSVNPHAGLDVNALYESDDQESADGAGQGGQGGDAGAAAGATGQTDASEGKTVTQGENKTSKGPQRRLPRPGDNGKQ